MILKKAVKIDALILTIIAFILAFSIHWLFTLTAGFIKLQFLNPEGRIEADFQIEDLFFSKSKREPGLLNKDIILIDVNEMSKDSIMLVIKSLTKMNPRVIGVDILFKNTSPKDSSIIRLLKNNNNIVLSSKYEIENGKIKYITPFNDSIAFIPLGYTNFISTNRYSTVRKFTPKVHIDTLSFAAAIVKSYSSDIFQTFIDRDLDMEFIHYRKSDYPFIVKEASQILNKDISINEIVNNKIVLLGDLYKKEEYNSNSDKYYSPLNDDLYERGIPDMSGIEIHAHAISMILKQDYIKRFNIWQLYAFTLLICYLLNILYTLLHNKSSFLFLVLFIPIQMILTFLIIFLSAFLFQSFNYIPDVLIILLPIWFCGEAVHFGNTILPFLHKKYNLQTSFKH